ncbi:MAG: 30S ribosomal protein S16 [Candidatus Gottesmanbacteria bacterium GW2011_GWA2_44_17]|uniref:30S ribosomal protein S16 n=1 Tax=Candidatus Gottesmanbacteria bacterium GW2011_GWA2_44_17 TaxID=1618444 RepID=A0A0G1JPX9_9BACT|nr:MAG: 30S ribosomal protein S16 [Candidatus Gottesmanbacteria bacterium GW2011_GWA2_44_17]
MPGSEVSTRFFIFAPQTGKRNAKKYRIIAIEEGKRRDGQAIEILGYYNPLVKPAQISLKKDRIDYWVSVGAVITDSVKGLMKK